MGAFMTMPTRSRSMGKGKYPYTVFRSKFETARTETVGIQDRSRELRETLAAVYLRNCINSVRFEWTVEGVGGRAKVKFNTPRRIKALVVKSSAPATRNGRDVKTSVPTPSRNSGPLSLKAPSGLEPF